MLRASLKSLRTKLSWEDLTLSARSDKLLHDLLQCLQQEKPKNAANAKRRFKPVFRAIFHGPPGTGKTMAAALLGKESGMDVYRVDLSMVVSKYIGETEKNLAKIFDKAAEKEWILFFDEADALFGKRTGMSDAHDKYANVDTAYLLQLIDAYPGLVILTTNAKQNIDEAFMRRLRFVIKLGK